MSAGEIGTTVPIHVACSCPWERAIPLRIVSETLAELRLCLRGRLQPSTPVLTYRCRHCKQVVVITAGQMSLANAEQFHGAFRP